MWMFHFGRARHPGPGQRFFTMGDKMITDRRFFISTSNFGKNNGDPAKDPRIPGNGHNDFPV